MMNKNTKKVSFLTTFLIGGVSLLVGLSFVKPANDVHKVRADDESYYLAGTMNDWNVNDPEFELTDIGDNKFEYVGLLSEGAAYVEFKVTQGSWEKPSFGYDSLDDESKPLFYNKDGGGNIEVAQRNIGITIIFDASKEEKQINATYEPYTLENLVESSKEGINPNYMRVWLDRGFFETGGELNSLQFGAKGTVTDETTIYEASGYRKLYNGPGGGDEGSHWLAYFDIPITSLIDGMDVRVVRVSDKRDVIWNRSGFYTWNAGDNNKVLYVGGNWDNTTLTAGIIDDEKEIPAEFTKDVLEGYLTCEQSAINGYLAFPEMSRTFFKKADGEWKISGLLDEVLIDDYASMDTSYTGGRGSENFNAYEKYQTMEYYYLATPEGLGAGVTSNTNSTSMRSVLIVGLLGITTLAGFYFLQKKKYS